MPSESDFLAMPCADAALAGRWGLFSALQNRWLDVVFTSQGEAREAADILRRAGARIVPPAVRSRS